MLYQKFRTLKSFRQILADGLFNDSGTGKSHQRPWFCKDNISKHGKTGADASGGRVCQNGNIQKSCFAVLLNCLGSLCHLHKGYDSFLHPGSAGTGKDHHWQFFFRRPFKCPCNLFAHDFSHAAHQKTGIADADHGFAAMNLCQSGDHRLVQFGSFF